MDAWESTDKNHNEDTFNLQGFPSDSIILSYVSKLLEGPQPDSNQQITRA